MFRRLIFLAGATVGAGVVVAMQQRDKIAHYLAEQESLPAPREMVVDAGKMALDAGAEKAHQVADAMDRQSANLAAHRELLLGKATGIKNVIQF